MSVIVKSDVAYTGDVNNLPNDLSPLPLNATAYANYRTGEYITKDGRGRSFSDVCLCSRDGAKFYLDQDGSFQTAGANIPILARDPAGLEILGLSGENAVVNIFSQPYDFSNAVYSAQGLEPVASNSDPFAFTMITADTSTGLHRLVMSQATPGLYVSDHVSSFSIAARYRGSARYLYLYEPGTADVYATFDILNGEVSGIGANVLDAQISPYVDGSWCCTIYASPISENSPYRFVIGLAAEPNNKPASNVFTGSGEALDIGFLNGASSRINGPHSYQSNIGSSIENIRLPLSATISKSVVYVEYMMGDYAKGLNPYALGVLCMRDHAEYFNELSLAFAGSDSPYVNRAVVYQKIAGVPQTPIPMPEVGTWSPRKIVKVMIQISDSGVAKVVAGNRVLTLPVAFDLVAPMYEALPGYDTASRSGTVVVKTEGYLLKSITYENFAFATDAELLAEFRRVSGDAA